MTRADRIRETACEVARRPDAETLTRSDLVYEVEIAHPPMRLDWDEVREAEDAFVEVLAGQGKVWVNE